MGSRLSEEQKNDLKIKIQIGIFLAIVAAAIYVVGPGLPKVLEYARKNKDKEWAPRWYLRIAKTYNSTFREKQAMEVCQEFYLNWSGDESRLPLDDALESLYGEKYDRERDRWIWPRVACNYVGRDAPKRPPWQGGEGAKPHELLPEILMMVIKQYEGERDYPPVRHILRASLAPGVFTPGTKVYKRLEEAKIRDLVRGM